LVYSRPDLRCSAKFHDDNHGHTIFVLQATEPSITGGKIPCIVCNLSRPLYKQKHHNSEDFLFKHFKRLQDFLTKHFKRLLISKSLSNKISKLLSQLISIFVHWCYLTTSTLVDISCNSGG